MNRKYDGIIIHTGDDCTVHFPNEGYVYADLKSVFADQAKITVEIKSRRKPRNLDQNAYLHVCLGLIADETGNDLDTVKNTVKAMYAKQPLLDKNGDQIYDKVTSEAAYYIQDTRDMSTTECFEFTERVRMFAQDFCGMVLPLPDEQIDINFKK